MNRLLPLLLILACAGTAYAQKGKAAPNFKGTQAPESIRLNRDAKLSVPLSENPFNLETIARNPISTLMPLAGTNNNVQLTIGENGLPIMLEGKTAASGSAADSKPVAERALDYLASLQPASLTAPSEEFVVKAVQTDEQGNNHIRMDQVFQGLPVWGGELIAHTKNGAFERVNGRYFPTPKLATTTPSLDKSAALNVVKNDIGLEKIKTDWSAEELELIDGPQFSAELLVFHLNGALNTERLAWHIIAHPNLLSRTVYFVDAATGEILDMYDNTCNFAGHRHAATSPKCSEPTTPPSLARSPERVLAGSPATVQGLDLFNTNRSFNLGGWQVGSTYYLENSNTSMFNSSGSNMPSSPVGVIVTLDGLGNSPENNNFDYTLATSNSSTFNNQKEAISAHYNAGVSFNYFKSKFNRSSIDGNGGNILSFVKITESNGAQMDNAFWNGAAMWYGNGATLFNSLARGLDVGGHEMTHGVVEKTANLVYQNESGALNESFADVFGVLIENDSDWKIGEDVVKAGVSPNGCLRDLSNPHNGATSSSSWWQPNHVNEKYTGTQDNGGVHINSGIPNYAFYLFATNAAVGKTKAEQVYYKALRDYLTKSSKFVDCRIAVIQAAMDLYGTTEANAAASAFTAVGIGGSAPSGNYLGQLNPNPGTDFVLGVSNNLQNLNVFNVSGTYVTTLYNQGVQSRPSITDSGQEIVFVNSDDHIIYIALEYTPGPSIVSIFELSDFPEWRQAAISKDGRYVAALSNVQEPYIYVFDFGGGSQRKFKLYNPTYTQGQVTGDVGYADVLEFDYSGKNLMYDAYNELINSQGQDLSYWDIGFLEFWKNGQFAPANTAFISKLFTGIPENTSIGDPAFAKNSPYVIAFDFIDQTTSNTRYDVYGANSETGKYDVIVSNNGVQGWPNYNRLDSKLLYEVSPSNGIYNLRVQNVDASKIKAIGGSSLFTSNHSWGVWYANGIRSLTVDSKEPGTAPLQISVTPNPVLDFTQISLTAQQGGDAQVSVCNMMGQILLTRNVTLQQGENRLDFDMSTLPSGSYIVRIAAGGAGAAVKVLKG